MNSVDIINTHKSILEQLTNSKDRMIIDKVFADYLHDYHSKQLITINAILDRCQKYIESQLVKELERNSITGVNIIAILNGGYRFAKEVETFLDLNEIETSLSLIRVKTYTGLQQNRDSTNIEKVHFSSTFPHLSKSTLHLIIDDIYDNGYTIKTTLNWINTIIDINQTNIGVLTLLKKSKVDPPKKVSKQYSVLDIDNSKLFIQDALFEIPNVWVYGHGLDLFGHKRTKHSIYQLI